MPFVHRTNGKIVSVHGKLMPGYNDEELPDDHPDVVAFFAPINKQAQISALEGQVTVRMIREALAGSTSQFPQGHPRAGKTAAQTIAAIDAQIVALRGG